MFAEQGVFATVVKAKERPPGGGRPKFIIIVMYKLFAKASWRQWTYQGTHHRHILLAARQALAHQEVRRNRQVGLFQRHIRAEAVEERQLEVWRLAQGTVRTDLYAVTTEDTAIQREGVAFQRALGHHQRTGRTDLHTGTT